MSTNRASRQPPTDAAPAPLSVVRSRLAGRRLREWGTVALATLLLALLGELAVLQHHWLGRASEADLQRTSASLQAAAERFGDDFNRELADLLAELMPILLEGLESSDVSRAVETWRARASWPELVESVWQISEGEISRIEAADGPESATTGPESRAAVPAPVRRLAEQLAAHLSQADDEPAAHTSFLDHLRILMPEVPAIVLPRRGGFRHGHHDGRRRDPRGRWRRHLTDAEGVPSLHVLLLDREVIRTQVLPDLATRHFSAETELGLRVVDGSGQTVWTSAVTEDVASEMPAGAVPVAQAELFGPLRPRLERTGPGGGARRRGLFGANHDLLAAAAGLDRGQWLLQVIHPAGTLDAAVAAARHRNLALSLFILLVLAVSVLLLAYGARRAQALAQRQLDFVAGVTHELRTPVAALRSAGQNLADGLVKPERVQTYGRLVDREGRRLEEAVGQILAFAGLSSGGSRRLAVEALDPQPAVERAVADLAPLLAERNVEVEVRCAPDLPRVRADAESLGRALRNLVQNAALHGQPPERDVAAATGWVGVEIDASKGRVRFRVSDHGPGIEASDRKRVFEPFVRGRGLAASNVPGSGLGLALVRQVADAYGGSVELASGGGTSTFTFSLPAE